MKHSTQYLYDINPSELRGMGYEEALEYKLAGAREVYRNLYSDGEDYDRQFWVLRALEHTRNLIEELKE